MPRLGVDFGTTNTVAVSHDRGLYPVVLHVAETAVGRVVREVFPSVMYVERSGPGVWFGPEAERRLAQRGLGPGRLFVSSLKRTLKGFIEGRRLPWPGDADGLDPAALLQGFLGALRDSIRRSGAFEPEAPLECVVSWPANANGAQRYITRRCFKAAGFEVLGSIAEPTASAVEFADRITRGDRRAARRYTGTVAVFDLGGGTFDVSVVRISGGEFRVLATAGIDELGGDDFDRVLLEMFLDRLGLRPEDLSFPQRIGLLRHARAQKEAASLGPAASLVLNPADHGIAGPPVAVPLAAYFERLRPLLRPAVDRLAEIVEAGTARPNGAGPQGLSAVYLVGGSSKLPLVPAMVAERFPDARLLSTDQPFTSVAMGAAIVCAEAVPVQEIFARHFGVIRLAGPERREVFWRIFPAGTPLPRKGEPPLVVETTYHPAHNIGLLGYLECLGVTADGLPVGAVRRWGTVSFPYDPRIPLEAPIRSEEVVETETFSQLPVVERYACDADGVITVELRRPADGQARTLEIWSD